MEPVDIFLSKMTSVFEKHDRVYQILLPCFQHLIIRPRFHMISILDIMCEKMGDNSKVEEFKEFYKSWIMSNKNKNFTKLYYVQDKGTIKIPPEIKKTFKNIFNDNIEVYLNKHVNQQDNETIMQLTDAYIQNWRNPISRKERINVKQEHKEVKDEGYFKKGRNESGFMNLNSETDIVLNDEVEHSVKDIKNLQKLKRVNEKIILQYKKGIQEIKKADKERFINIFKEFGIVDAKLKGVITNIWYGDINSDDPDSNCILNIIKKKKLKSKISNYNIKSSTNRLILQTYITGLIINRNVYDIFTVIDSLDNNVDPEIVYSKGKPNNKIQEILNNIINELYLSPGSEEINIRENWEKMKKPTINVDNLINYIDNSNDIHESNKYLIKSRIKELNNQTTMEKFTKEVHSIIKDISVKNITEANIYNNLRYY